MSRKLHMRGPVAVFAIGLAGSWSTTAALAACGMAAVVGGASGSPSISTTETSTTQVLEQIRRRTQEAQQQQPIPVVDTAPAAEATVAEAPAAETTAEAASEAAGSAQAASEGSSQAATAAAAPAPKPKAQGATISSASKPKAAKATTAKTYEKTYDKEPTTDSDYAVSQRSVGEGGNIRTTAVWGQGFLGYDRHSNLAPGNQENPTRTAKTAGGMVGADWTHITRDNGVRAVQYGMFSGYSETRARKSDTFFFTDEIDANGNEGQDGINDTNYFRTNNKEDIDGPFVGAYLAVVQDAWTFDMAVKADFFDLTQSSTLTQRCADDVGTQNGSASVNNYMIAANIAHRYDLTESQWWEPVIGARYTYTDFGNDPSNSVFVNGGAQTPGRLGLEDGSALRLQFGARLGNRVETADGYIWTTTVGAFLYSDVLITGFETFAGQTGEAVFPVDEGKVRVLGQLETRINVGNGLSYLLQAEVRGDRDVFGAAGQLGLRYEW
ncbi:MAG: autotransporter outer membrane beta-barrel domain-containing protein [Hyphomicrobium sp.]|nr:autotransporter outer membrane beta-barrel domain-containing protein [Hyphomicrobium sp.]